MAKECSEIVTHSLVMVEENKRKVVFKNAKKAKFQKVRVDECLIKQGKRCDYLVSEVGKFSVLIELKGADVSKACEQLMATVDHPAAKPLLQPKTAFLVVCRKYPRFDTFVAKAKQACAKRFGSGFHVVCDQRELDIAKVAAIDGPY